MFHKLLFFFKQLLKKLPSYLKMNLVVTEDYIDGFIRADNTFLYQLAFDPLTHKLCPLTPYPPEVELEALRYAGPYFSDERALQIALGNVDIHTHERIGSFDPQTYIVSWRMRLSCVCMMVIFVLQWGGGGERSQMNF